MSKTMRNVLIIIGIVLLIFAVLLVIYQQFKTEPVNTNTIGNLVQNNTNTQIDSTNNEIPNENEPDDITNNKENIQNTNQNNSSKTEDDNQIDDNKENQTTPREDKAIQLAKEAWKKERGSTDEVTFGNVSMQGDGKYVVCVSDNITTVSVCFYIVDVDTGVATER